ncbi:hypothetical protein FDG2_2462 [Candidatus Protofrankia californiensis]|uniref:Uncharacterized protein n=1 Tax=Candidatus Protofrankia californiensis TaxID=1839754 RepID=A0A1C3NXM5_9ACTN|nr:hypothetical protein FDG2_2462 [Candidatus Protofrankia californiensis]
MLTLPFLAARLKFSVLHAYVTALWAVLALLLIINANRAPALGRFLPGNLQAGIDNYLYPLAALVMVSCWLSIGHTRLDLLKVICQVFVVLVGLNGIVAFASMFVDPTERLQRFWGYAPATLETTVAVRAFENGRLTGIFAQPAEAGVAYSLALLSAIYLFGRPDRDRPIILGLAATPVLVGGVLSVSKTFLLVGLPLAVWQAVRQGRRIRRVVVLGGMIGLVKIITTQVNLPDWRGSWMLSLLVTNTGGDAFLTKYTAGRLGVGSPFSVAFQYVLDTQPWFGYGAGGLAVAYDSSWIEMVIVGGLFGVGLFALVLLVIISGWLRGNPTRSAHERPFATAVLILSVAATAGIPAFTANRVGLFIWIFLTLLVLTKGVTTTLDEKPRVPRNRAAHSTAENTRRRVSKTNEKADRIVSVHGSH